MKLRNKKTGEIGYLIVGKGSDHYIVTNDEWESCGNYGSLAELTEEWEDAPDEEPKEYWWIDSCGGVLQEYFDGGCVDIQRKQIGNYFGTKEEAEKAVEKLKAFKRLKDKGLELNHWKESPLRLKPSCFVITGHIDIDHEVRASLDLLFGGEE